MYDFMNCCTTAAPAVVLGNAALSFDRASQVDRSTGEEITRRGILGGLKISYNLSSQLLNINGSLQKYHTGGVNHTDFTREDVAAAVQRLGEELRLNPARLVVHSLEAGLNAAPPAGCSDIISRMHLYRPGALRPFRPMENLASHFGKDTKTGSAKHWFKGYNKAHQNSLPTPVLRFEVHGQSYHLCNKLGRSELTVADLTTSEVWNGCATLFTAGMEGIVWHEPVAVDRMPSEDALFYQQAGRWEYWHGVKGKARTRQLDRYVQLSQEYRTDDYTSQMIRAAMVKLEELTTPSQTARAARSDHLPGHRSDTATAATPAPFLLSYHRTCSSV